MFFVLAKSHAATVSLVVVLRCGIARVCLMYFMVDIMSIDLIHTGKVNDHWIAE